MTLNPRLIAEDIAKHYEAKRNPHLPHAQNVKKYLRKPVLAITRRVLLPRINYDEIDDSLIANIGNEQFGVNSSALVDPTFSKGKEGLDWRDYLTVPGSGKGSPTARSGGRDQNMNIMSMAFSMSETETETEDERVRGGNGNGNVYMHMNMPVMKLSRRSLSRMEAFLTGCALALPSHSVSAVSVTKRVNDVASSGAKSLANMDMSSLRSSLPFGGWKKKQQNNANQQPSPAANKTIEDAAQSGRKSKTDPSRNYPQMHSNELILRLELYIRTIRRVYTVLHPKSTEDDSNAEEKKQSPPQQPSHLQPADECVIHLEPPRAIKTRIRLLIDSLISSAGSVGSMHNILTTLLTHFTLEVLAVELISADLQSFIRKIVLEYEHQTSFASLAFLSTPEDSAETQLAPLVARYVEYLQRERVRCVFECRLESTLARAIDPMVRKLFKTVEFQSIGHLLDICRDHRDGLENIVISSRDASILTTSSLRGGSAKHNSTGGPGAGSSASVDNGLHLLTNASFDGNTVEMCSNTKVVKQALRDLRRETITINGQILPPPTSLTELVNLLRERLNSKTMKLRDSRIGNSSRRASKSLRNSSPLCSDSSEHDSDSQQHQQDGDGNESLTTSESDIGFISSGCEGDGDTDATPQTKPRTKSFEKEPKLKRRIFNVDAIDILTRRLLIAASRTRGGGDAFFVVRDLFGGEGVKVIPATESYHGPYNAGKVSATIELTVRLASITIKCHSKFDVYPEENVAECEPFIQLHTTTTEIIELQEVRVDDNGLELEIPNNNINGPGESCCSDKPTKVMLKEKVTESSGRRILSIKPARYEKVDNWKTPS